jgi:hypothetical protein
MLITMGCALIKPYGYGALLREFLYKFDLDVGVEQPRFKGLAPSIMVGAARLFKPPLGVVFL